MLVTLSADAQWRTVHTSDSLHYQNLFLLANGEVALSTGWTGIAYLNADHEPDRLERLDTFYADFFSHYTFGGKDYLSGGCYYCTAAIGGNTVYRRSADRTEWERVETETTFRGFGVLGSLVPTDNPNELIVQQEYGTTLRLDLQTGTVLDTLRIGTEEGSSNGRIVYDNQGRYATMQTSRVHVPAGGIPTGNFVLVQNFYGSTDGGNSWELLDIEFQSEDEAPFIYDYTPGGRLVIITSESRMYSYKDGVTHFIGQITDRDERPGILQIIDDKVMYLSTRSFSLQYANLYRSVNGGATWEVEHTVDDTGYTQLAFSDREHGYALIGSKQIIRREGPTTTEENPIGLSVFPNPAGERLFLRSNVLLEEVTAVIYTIDGREMSRFRVSEDSIPVGPLLRGTYLLRIERDGEILASGVKFVKF